MAKGSGAKGTGAKGSGPKQKPAKGASAKPAAAKAKGSDAAQPELDFAAPAEETEPEVEAVADEPTQAEPAEVEPAPAEAPPAPAASAEAAVPAADAVVELVNGVDGVWKKLANGKRVNLTPKEWRQELSRLFTRAPAP